MHGFGAFSMSILCYCIPITASTGGGKAGGHSGADIQMTQEMHQNRVFSMSNPVCNHQTHLDTSVHCEWAHPFTVDSGTSRSHGNTGLT